MNSWGSDRLEGRIDALLRLSVEKGSEPSDIIVKLPPERPAFPWARIASVIAAAVLLGFFAVQLIQGYELPVTSFSLSSLFCGISLGEALSAAAIAVGVIGSVTAFIPDWNETLRRLL